MSKNLNTDEFRNRYPIPWAYYESDWINFGFGNDSSGFNAQPRGSLIIFEQPVYLPFRNRIAGKIVAFFLLKVK